MGFKITRVAALSSLFITLVAFQNCAKTNFSNSADGMQKSLSSGLGSESDMTDPNGNAEGSVYQASDSTKEDPNEPESPKDLVACILVDHGKSLKLGLIENQLVGVNAVSDSICISRSACLIDVAKVFLVEGAYDRGYCEHNPNVVRINDADLSILLKQAIQ